MRTRRSCIITIATQELTPTIYIPSISMSFATYSRSPGPSSFNAGATSYLSSSLQSNLLSLNKQDSLALLTLLQNEACTSPDAIGLIEGFVYSLQDQKQSPRPSPLTYSVKPSPPSPPSRFPLPSPSPFLFQPPFPSPSFSPSSSQSTSPTPQLSIFDDQSIHEVSPQLLRERARRMQNEASELSDLASLLDDAMLVQEYAAQAVLTTGVGSRLQVNNMHRKPNEVDLHGLYVAEALDFTARCVTEAQAQGDEELTFIVGRGLHSSDGRAKLAPAVEGKLRKMPAITRLKLEPAQHPKNAGMLVVRLKD
ncbi:hypothetical protein EVG20_g5546 [Dentipellis fragilis]|uniref:Smr domain-containing protein n=1 Tax=Dentipellis fragilis TaxID=205917 RepID=A0A4Y9YTQ9_9AGAM|nr:hypothetical protein EVG20_g5546 [Dentipellis fragilis]